ncbi:MAG: hypothetical protein NCW75_02190 [Phycisphaera sp.]|nr:MAG: hypothetical protein NCW75_02190 [Phycisphaera sp.]
MDQETGTSADAFNNTPFWIIQVTSDISSDHNDTRNPVLAKLIDQISQLNGLYQTEVQVWMRVGPAEDATQAP